MISALMRSLEMCGLAVRLVVAHLVAAPDSGVKMFGGKKCSARTLVDLEKVRETLGRSR